MDFTGEHGIYENLDLGLLPPLFIAYTESLSKSSGKVHNVMRYRANIDHDEKIMDVMRRKAELVDRARELLEAGRAHELGEVLSEDFELRRSAYTISQKHARMVEIALECGAHAKFTGSGGAVIGTYSDEEHYDRLERAYISEGFAVFRVRPVP